MPGFSRARCQTGVPMSVLPKGRLNTNRERPPGAVVNPTNAHPLAPMMPTAGAWS